MADENVGLPVVSFDSGHLTTHFHYRIYRQILVSVSHDLTRYDSGLILYRATFSFTQFCAA